MIILITIIFLNTLNNQLAQQIKFMSKVLIVISEYSYKMYKIFTSMYAIFALIRKFYIDRLY